jgi:hypothetical protein
MDVPCLMDNALMLRIYRLCSKVGKDVIGIAVKHRMKNGANRGRMPARQAAP